MLVSRNPLLRHNDPKRFPEVRFIVLLIIVSCDKFSKAHRCYLTHITKIVELKFFHEAVKDVKSWEAMAKEIEALELNNTWSIVDLLSKERSLLTASRSQSEISLWWKYWAIRHVLLFKVMNRWKDSIIIKPLHQWPRWLVSDAFH